MFLFVCFVVAGGLEAEQVVEYLNTEYSKISGNSRTLYNLVKTITWEASSDIGGTEGILLLNNTYKGLSLHEFKALEVEKEVQIKSHTIPKEYPDPLGTEYIQDALLTCLNLQELELDSLEVTKANVSIAILYSSTVDLKNFKYSVDVLKHNQTTFQYVSQTPILAVPKTVIKESLKYSGIIIAGISGFSLTFLALCLFHKRYGGLPFVKMSDMREFRDEQVN